VSHRINGVESLIRWVSWRCALLVHAPSFHQRRGTVDPAYIGPRHRTHCYLIQCAGLAVGERTPLKPKLWMLHLWYSNPMKSPRSLAQRKADALAKLMARQAELWVASASPSGGAHLVPLSFAWDGEHLIIATEVTAITTHNIASARRARLALGGTRDVVMIDAILVRQIDLAEAPTIIAERYAAQADWDPRSEGGDYVYSVLRPERIQVWREVNEMAGRTVMQGGAWLV